ncbi:FliM/FliN family flagellar motor switch protein [Paracoccus sp. J56]|uniref:FliM/FliN family flagellar motor switch protein n=1 Tax=Paracoccus sp. J56 TaxID=935850 RepID=UPI000A0E9D8A|nr:FliM/FliN family flagellar motor switch protein [Paracoccus sp. J56]SMG28186.1 flagellar motor switch protein FliM [Paracoccus sp. J56]
MVLRHWITQRDRMRSDAGTSGYQVAELQLESAVATAFARAAEKQARLAVLVEKAELAQTTPAELQELLPERAILSVVEGRQDMLGVVAICPSLLGSLIEMQAIGRVTARPISPRRPTRTDATIAADFAETLLTELSRQCGTHPDSPDFGAFRYLTHIDEPRLLALMLEEGRMTRLSLQFHIGPEKQRQGSLLLALPAPADTRQTLPDHIALQHIEPIASPPLAEAREVIKTASTLAGIVQETPLPLVSVLCRRKISLNELRALTPGALLSLPRNSLNEARIESPYGQLILQGKLGEKDGLHAIRLQAGDKDGSPIATDIPGRSDDNSFTQAVTASLGTSARQAEDVSMLADADLEDPFRPTTPLTKVG